MAFGWQAGAALGTGFREFALVVCPMECPAMPFLCILCPIKNKSFATSVEISTEHKASLPNILKFSFCHYCCALHGWTPDEAFFDGTEHETFLCEATAASPGSNVTTNVRRRRKGKPQQSTVGPSSRKRTVRGQLG